MKRLLPLLMCLVSACFIGAGWVMVAILVFITRLMTVARFLLGLVLAAFLVGCGSGMNPQPRLPAKPIPIHNPFVAFIGDSITAQWLSPDVLAQHPQWINEGSPAGVVDETSGQVLARFQADVIEHNPKVDIVHVLVGTYDVATPNWPQPCGTDSGNAATCVNIQQMITMATAANIKVIYGTIPPIGPGPLATELEADNQEMQGNAALYNRNLLLVNGFQVAPWSSATLVDYSSALFADTEPYTVDGINPSPSGYAIMTGLVEPAIAAFKVGGAL